MYDLIVSVSDRTDTVTQPLAVGVTQKAVANTPPAVTSPDNFFVSENNSDVGQVMATDLENDPLTYAIAGGPDAVLFNIDTATGALRFKDVPDFEIPLDVGGDNIFDIIVSVDDGMDAVSQNIFVTVEDVPEDDVSMLNIFLVNTMTDEVITQIMNGDVFQFTDLADQQLTISAEINEDSDLFDQVNSATLDFAQGQFQRVENFAPYALFGDNGKGNFFGGIELSTGNFELSVEFFDGKNATGDLLEQASLSFDIV